MDVDKLTLHGKRIGVGLSVLVAYVGVVMLSQYEVAHSIILGLFVMGMVAAVSYVLGLILLPSDKGGRGNARL